MTARATITGQWKEGWFVVPYDVLFRDLDSFGHVNNAVFFTYFELARTQLWLALTGGGRAADVAFIVARAECDFRRQIEMERIEIFVKISELRTTSFDFVYEIRKDGGSELAATGKVTAVLFDWEKREKMPISDALRAEIAAFQQG